MPRFFFRFPPPAALPIRVCNTQIRIAPPTIDELEPESLLEAVLAEATNEDDESETPIIDAITDKVSDILAKELESDAEAPIITAISENTGESEDLILDELQAELNGDTEDAPLVAAVVEGIIENAIAKEEEVIDLETLISLKQ